MFKKILISVSSILLTLSFLYANNAIEKCINGGGIYIPDKGCLIENRAVCDGINPDLNNNVTYGWANQIPSFATNYVELGDFNVSNITYTAKIDSSCRPMVNQEIKMVSTVQMLSKNQYSKKGTFIHYGPHAFDWAYIDNNGSIIAYLKPSEGGFLEYIVTTPAELGITIEQNATTIRFIWNSNF